MWPRKQPSSSTPNVCFASGRDTDLSQNRESRVVEEEVSYHAGCAVRRAGSSSQMPSPRASCPISPDVRRLVLAPALTRPDTRCQMRNGRARAGARMLGAARGTRLASRRLAHATLAARGVGPRDRGTERDAGRDASSVSTVRKPWLGVCGFERQASSTTDHWQPRSSGPRPLALRRKTDSSNARRA